MPSYETHHPPLWFECKFCHYRNKNLRKLEQHHIDVHYGPMMEERPDEVWCPIPLPGQAYRVVRD